MLRRTRFSLSISDSRPKPIKKEWIYQWSLIVDDVTSEDPDDAEEYVQEWNFPYPGQKELLSIDAIALLSINMPLAPKHKLQRGRVTYLKQNVSSKRVVYPSAMASLKK
ncbi:hypothetical protein [Endozoicomonas sp.]|uniref:hypothetical protein n=1 Tax=Endozoicomonas sp. TaxID=1892382 RepID=UPI003AF9DED1